MQRNAFNCYLSILISNRNTRIHILLKNGNFLTVTYEIVMQDSIEYDQRCLG